MFINCLPAEDSVLPLFVNMAGYLVLPAAVKVSMTHLVLAMPAPLFRPPSVWLLLVTFPVMTTM